jgi:hypothetical protein
MSKYDAEYIRGINRYRIKEYLELLSSSFGKLEERKKKEKELSEKLDRVKQFSNEIKDKHELLGIVKELQAHLVQNLDQNDEVLHASALKSLLGEIRKINQRLIEEEQKKELESKKRKEKKSKSQDSKKVQKSKKSKKKKVSKEKNKTAVSSKKTKKSKFKKKKKSNKLTPQKKIIKKKKSNKSKKKVSSKPSIAKVDPSIEDKPSTTNLEASVVASEYAEIRKRLNKLKKQLVD